MASKKKTGFDRYFETRMKTPVFAKAHAKARAEIDGADQLVRSLDEARTRLGLTKAALARKTGTRPEVVRRLLTAEGANPEIATVIKLASALGCHLELVPDQGQRDIGRARPGRRMSK